MGLLRLGICDWTSLRVVKANAGEMGRRVFPSAIAAPLDSTISMAHSGPLSAFGGRMIVCHRKASHLCRY